MKNSSVYKLYIQAVCIIRAFLSIIQTISVQLIFQFTKDRNFPRVAVLFLL